jgi:hypothetical protein
LRLEGRFFAAKERKEHKGIQPILLSAICEDEEENEGDELIFG